MTNDEEGTEEASRPGRPPARREEVPPATGLHGRIRHSSLVNNPAISELPGSIGVGCAVVGDDVLAVGGEDAVDVFARHAGELSAQEAGEFLGGAGLAVVQDLATGFEERVAIDRGARGGLRVGASGGGEDA